MKEKIRNWWIRNKNSNWLYAFLLTCFSIVLLLAILGFATILIVLCKIHVGLVIIALFAFLFFAFLILLKEG